MKERKEVVNFGVSFPIRIPNFDMRLAQAAAISAPGEEAVNFILHLLCLQSFSVTDSRDFVAFLLNMVSN